MEAKFGSFFRQRRKTLGLSLREFCRQNGFDPGNLSRLERGLLSPPHAKDLLESYAKALKLEPESSEWLLFFDLAAAETGRVPQQIAQDEVERANLPKRFQTWRDERRRYVVWTNATALELWADYLDARAQLPRLIRRLIHATVDALDSIEFPAGEGIQRPGWDGIVHTATGNAFVPSGVSVWELGTDRDPGRKAEEDFQKRSKNPLGFDPRQTCFVFVTPRKWTKKYEWREKKLKLGKWKNVRVYDSANLEEWLETAPAADVWAARLLGLRPDGVSDIEEYWANLNSLTQPSLTPEIFLASREEESKLLESWLKKADPPTLTFQADSVIDVIDFTSAYIASLDDSSRDALGTRIVLVSEREAWKALSKSSTRLVMIPQPPFDVEPELVVEATRHGHQVLNSVQRLHADERHPILSRVSSNALEEALIASGMNKEQARRDARKTGGSLTVLKRLLARFPSSRQPEWSQSPNAQDLIPILLAGRWDDANAGDRSIIEQLSGRSYDDVLTIAHRWLTSKEPPLMRLLSCWRLVSREDSWYLLAPNITRSQLDAFEDIAVEILGENDPRYDLPSRERWLAGLRDKQPKYSGQLRLGIAETLALLGAKSDADVIHDEIGPKRRAEVTIRKLLTGAGRKRWASLSRLLPILAEASPEAFLEAIENDLGSGHQEPQLPKLLIDEGDPPFSSCPHAGLLWALETLAWQPSLLTRVSLALTRLAQVDPGGRWANRPINSLRAIFLPWLPQTTASVEQRIRVLRILPRKVPDIGWRLLLDLLPTFNSTSSYTRRPSWHDWALNWSQGIPNAEYWQQIQACGDLLIKLVGTDTGRWVDVIEQFENFPESAQARLIGRLREFDISALETAAQKKISDALREKINWHRSYPDADWVLPADTLDELEGVKERFEPQDLLARYLWLFSHPHLIDGLQDSWQRREEKFFQLRRDALEEILHHDGWPRVLELVGASEESREVGLVLGKAQLLESDAPILPPLLISENKKLVDFAIGYGIGRFTNAGWDWIKKLEVDQWTPEQAGRFLAYVPYSERKTWEFVENLGTRVAKEYWSQVHGFYRTASIEDAKYAVAILLKHHRPFQAVDVLLTLQDLNSIESSLLMDTLEAGLKKNKEKTLEANASYKVQSLFEHLQADPHVDVQQLASLEWGYLRFLSRRRGVSPKTLLRSLQTNPRFFADLIGLVFLSDKDIAESSEPLTEDQKVRAENAYHLLKEWKSIPGLGEDGSVDESALLAWVKEARRLCEESGRLRRCDRQIGQVLAHAPSESDGTWPCIPVRDVIDEIDSIDLTGSFETSIFNKRGPIVKSPFAGGNQERGLAQQYTSYAEACATEWPTTAAALRRIARHYTNDARREDEEAQARSLD